MAPEKTEIVILEGPRGHSEITFRIGATTITPTTSVKYVGIHLDSRGSFGKHIREVVGKAEGRLATLSRLMSNIGGLSSGKRRLLNAVVESILLYGAPIWYKAMKVQSYRRMMETIKRRSLLIVRLVRGYRTVSTPALQVAAGIIPIHLQVDERRRVFERGGGAREEIRTEARERTLQKWQEEWERETTKGQWTKQLIPNVAQWVNCKHKNVDYFLTQALTGHGFFRDYTFRIRKSENNRCIYCNEEDGARHTIFECNRWVTYRLAWDMEIGELRPYSMVREMLESKRKWTIMHNVIERIMTAKEQEERRHQQEGIVYNPPN